MFQPTSSDLHLLPRPRGVVPGVCPGVSPGCSPGCPRVSPAPAALPRAPPWAPLRCPRGPPSAGAAAAGRAAAATPRRGGRLRFPPGGWSGGSFGQPPETMAGWWFEPLRKIWKSIGMMTFPIYGKIKNVPNHQPDGFWHRKKAHFLGKKQNISWFLQWTSVKYWPLSGCFSTLSHDPILWLWYACDITELGNMT